MDQDLVVRVQQGDQHAFETLATADYPRLFRVAHGVLGDRALAEDATQQALLDIWRKMRRLRNPAKYSGWSYRLLVRVCYAEAKRQPKWTMSDDLPPADEPRVADVSRGIADRDQLERGFRRLSVDHRVVLTLCYLPGMTPEEVAEALDLPRQTVYSRLQAATSTGQPTGRRRSSTGPSTCATRVAGGPAPSFGWPVTAAPTRASTTAVTCSSASVTAGPRGYQL